MGTGGGTAYNHGFVLVSKPGELIEKNGIGTVIVNKQFYGGFDKLKKAYPDVEFVKMCDATEHFTNQLRNVGLI